MHQFLLTRWFVPISSKSIWKTLRPNDPQVKSKSVVNKSENLLKKAAVPSDAEKNPFAQTNQHSKRESSPISTLVDIEDTLVTGGGDCVAVARTTMLERIRTAAGLGGAAASATVAEFHQYLLRLRAEEDGPFQCLVAALLRLEALHPTTSFSRLLSLRRIQARASQCIARS
jgi:hypothetical protein